MVYSIEIPAIQCSLYPSSPHHQDIDSVESQSFEAESNYD